MIIFTNCESGLLDNGHYGDQWLAEKETPRCADTDPEDVKARAREEVEDFKLIYSLVGCDPTRCLFTDSIDEAKYSNDERLMYNA